MKKWKMVLAAGTLAASFGLGAMAGPQEEPLAAANSGEPAELQNQNGQLYRQGPNGNGKGMGSYFAGTSSEAAADILGMTADELREARLSGQSLAEIAEQKGVTAENLLAGLLEVKKEQLDKMVEDGVITAEQKEYMLQNMEQNMENGIERTETGPMNGKGMRGGGKWNNNGGQRGSGQCLTNPTT
ncbi:DUF2680 domain-containing protein [Bacillus marinisedimentorum]|uniref:DUF2680 domain-containing protein n=1 Tax=Bacillus marinisedimentorum TaxID=1821260 RepID=UPI000872E4AC|nr:DUF2680 domain-containing protein [Bacillus marinisedimentorum]